MYVLEVAFERRDCLLTWLAAALHTKARKANTHKSVRHLFHSSNSLDNLLSILFALQQRRKEAVTVEVYS